MQRRRALLLGIASGIAFLGGCTNGGSSSGDLSTDGDDDSPIEADADALLLQPPDADDVLGGQWGQSEPHQESPITRSADATAGYISVGSGDSGPSGWINAGVWTFDAIDAARDTFDGHGYQSGYGFEDQEIAVESIAGTVSRNEAAVLFRDANVVGGVSRTDPDTRGDELVKATLGLAAAMHRSWRDG